MTTAKTSNDVSLVMGTTTTTTTTTTFHLNNLAGQFALLTSTGIVNNRDIGGWNKYYRLLVNINSVLAIMSRLTDYSKFDRIIDTDDEDDENGERSNGCSNDQACTTPASSIPPSSTHPTCETEAAAIASGMTQKHPTIPNRYIFTHTGQKVYEWEQSLEEVILYIDAPPHLLSHMQQHGGAANYILVDISPTKLRVGLVGADRYFIDEMTFDKVKIKESSWYIDDDDGDGVITIILAKCYRGQTWEGVLRGHDNNGTIDADGGVNNNGTTTNEFGGKTLHHETINPYVKQEMQRTMMLERFQEENPGFDFRDATFNGEVPDPRSFMGGVGYNH